jgi:hypothetical protein
MVKTGPAGREPREPQRKEKYEMKEISANLPSFS